MINPALQLWSQKRQDGFLFSSEIVLILVGDSRQVNEKSP